jgi:hypothetical protein
LKPGEQPSFGSEVLAERPNRCLDGKYLFLFKTWANPLKQKLSCGEKKRNSDFRGQARKMGNGGRKKENSEEAKGAPRQLQDGRIHWCGTCSIVG